MPIIRWGTHAVEYHGAIHSDDIYMYVNAMET